MPFVAMLGDRRVVALDLDEVEWARLRGQGLTMPGCGVRAVAKRLGNTRFFAHHRLVGCTTVHKPETEQHRALKAAVYHLIGQTPGWTPVLEHPASDRSWVADVMALGPDRRRVAFEIQLSRQSAQAWEERTQAYFKAGVLPVWVTPDRDRYERIELPIVHTATTKESDVPGDPTVLLAETGQHHPEKRDRSLGYRLQYFLLPGYVWEHGSPQQQRERLAADDRARAAALESERLERERREAAEKAEAEQRRLALQDQEARKVHVFIGDAIPMEAPPVSAAGDAWATSVACPTCRARSVVWTCGKTGNFHVAAAAVVGRAERTPWAKGAIERWLLGVEHEQSLAIMSFGRSDPARQHPGFFCPVCRNRILQGLLARIPEERWARAALSTRERAARSPRLWTPKSTPPTAPHRIVPLAGKSLIDRPRPSAVAVPTTPPEEAGLDPAEVRKRAEAREARAVEQYAVRSNPQYVAVAGDWEYRCTACGGIFEDLREGRHKDRRCTKDAR